MTLRLLSIVAALLLGGACAAPTDDSQPVTVSSTRVVPHPLLAVRGAVPYAIADLGPGRWSHHVEGQRDRFQAVTESGTSVTITAKSQAEQSTWVNVVVLSDDDATANWLLFVVQDSIGTNALRLEPVVSQLSQIGYVGSGESDQ